MKKITNLFLTMAAVLFVGALSIPALAQTAKSDHDRAQLQRQGERAIAVESFALTHEEVQRVSALDDLHLPGVDFSQAVKYIAEDVGVVVIIVPYNGGEAVYYEDQNGRFGTMMFEADNDAHFAVRIPLGAPETVEDSQSTEQADTQSLFKIRWPKLKCKVSVEFRRDKNGKVYPYFRIKCTF